MITLGQRCSAFRERIKAAPASGSRGASLALDAVLVSIAGFLALANLTVDTIPDGARNPDVGAAVLAAAMVLALALRRASPLAVLAVSTVSWLALALAPYPPVMPVVPVIAVFFLAAKRGGVSAGLQRWPEITAVAAGLALLSPLFILESPQAEAEVHVAYVLIAAVAWMVGERVYTRAERERAGQRTAVADERERLAREIHDSVGHTINAIGISAGSARLNFDSDPGTARRAVAQIEEAARQAAREMDSFLGDLDGELPGAEAITALIAGQRAQGQPITAQVDPMAGVDPAVGRALYRIIQESLTNAARHAPESPVDLSIIDAEGWITLEVTNRGSKGPLTPGRGVAGMSARAREVGGNLTVSAEADRVVVAGRLPSESD